MKLENIIFAVTDLLSVVLGKTEATAESFSVNSTPPSTSSWNDFLDENYPLAERDKEILLWRVDYLIDSFYRHQNNYLPPRNKYVLNSGNPYGIVVRPLGSFNKPDYMRNKLPECIESTAA